MATLQEKLKGLTEEQKEIKLLKLELRITNSVINIMEHRLNKLESKTCACDK